MTKLQLIVVSLAGAFLLILYFGFDKRPAKQSAIDRSRTLQAEVTDISVLLKEAKTDITQNDADRIIFFEQSVNQAETDSIRINFLEQLSGKWFELGHPEIAGYYAEEIAGLNPTEQTWAITGTTYAIGVQRAKTEKVKSYCSARAVQAFENAISINPGEISHQVNLALCFTDYPPKDNPMKGILMLVDLNKKNPENVLVLTNLGRLAIQTGQYSKAAERLERVIELDPQNEKAHCLLPGVYESLGQFDKAKEYQQKCIAIAEH